MEREVVNLQQAVVAFLAFGSGAVYAGTIGPACDTGSNVTVPCEHTDWEFGAKALYLQPYLSNISGQRTFSTTVGNSVTAGQGTKWAWGGMIEGAYYFNTGNDVNLNWYHIKQLVKTNLRYDSKAFPANDMGLSDKNGSIVFSDISSKYNPLWDAVNLEFGQRVDYDKHRHIRLYAGATYTRIASNTVLNINGIFTTPEGLSSAYVHSFSADVTYNGIGPRLGADLAYAWGNGLAIYANGGGALLVGASKYSNFENLTNLAINGSNTVAVPELEAKLGATYGFIMAQGNMNLDVGWMWINYLGALSIANTSILAGPSSSNFCLQGPFIGFKWMGNIG